MASLRRKTVRFLDWLVDTGKGRTVLVIVCVACVALALEALVIQ